MDKKTKAVSPSELEALRAENTRLKKALTENEARIKALVHGIPDLIWLKNIDGIFLNCNHAFEQLFGATEAEIVGKTDYDFVDKDLADFFRANDLAAMRADKPLVNEEWVTYASDGRRVLLETIKTPLHNSSNELIGILGVARDITERKQIQEQIEFQRQVLLTQQDTSPDAILIADEDGQILTYNQHFVELWGVPEELLESRDDAPVLNFVLGRVANADEFLAKVKWLYKHRDEHSHDEIRLKDGRYIDRISAPVSTNEKYFGRVWYFRDITERRLAQEKLQASDDLLTKLSQNVMGFIYQFRMTPEGSFSVPFAGGAAEEYFGMTLEAVRQDASPVFEKVHPEDLEGFVASIHESALTLQPWRHEFRTRPSPGVTKWLYGTSVPEKDKDGNIIWYGYTTDLTESKYTQDALRMSEARYRAAFHGTLDAISISHLDSGLFLEVNQQFRDILGFSHDEVIGRTSFEINIWVNNEDRQRLVETVKRDGQCIDFEAPFRKRNGDVALGLMSAVVIEIDNTPCLFLFTRDITERKRAEAALQESEARLTAIIDGVQEGICVYDQNLRFILFNPFFEKVSGIPASDVLGRHILEIFPFIEEQGGVERLKSVLTTGSAGSEYQEYWFDIESTGRKGWVRTIDSPLKDAEGNTIGVISLVTDITEQLNTQKALKDLAHSLERQVEERTAQLVKAREDAEIEASATGEFMAEMSHEIRTPLNAIIGMAYLARNNDVPPALAGYLDQIHASGQHLLEVVNEVLDISKIQAGKQTVSQSGFSVKNLIDYVVGTVEKVATDKGLTLATELDPAMPDHLLGDSLRISQILINFMNNAIKFTENGSVSLRVLSLQFTESAVLVRFEVEDTGVGISREKLPLLFTPYEQLADDNHSVNQGTGLGLVICKKLAKLMGGRVGVESRYQQGSVFSFEVLLNQVGDGEAVVQAVGKQLIATPLSKEDLKRIQDCLSGCRVLLAEDNLINQHVIKELMGLVGVKVTLAQDGEEALRLLSKQTFDVVLMDIRMPKMDGVEATRVLRQNPAYSGLPILALTANASDASREVCVAAGMNDYIQKPIAPEKLFALLMRYYQFTQSVDSDAEKAAIAESDLQLFELLAQIPELDALAGVTLLMGRKDLYAGLARKIAAEYVAMPETLLSALHSRNITELAQHVHSMKSIFGALGAHHIQKQCTELEPLLTRTETISEEDMGRLIHDIAKLMEQLHSAIESVARH